MIETAQVTAEEKNLLLQFYRQLTFARVHEKAQTILLSSQGRSPYEIARVTFRDEKTIREWVKAFHGRRLASLFPAYRDNQNAAKLTRSQKEEISKALSQPPSAYGLPKEFWDISSLKSYLTAYFGLIYESDRSYHYLFKLSRFSFKLPAKFDRQRDEELVRRRVAGIRKALSPYLKDPDWVVLAGDESRLVWESLIRRCWLPKGKKSILRVERENLAQNWAGFLNLKDGQPHLFPVPWQNQREIIKVLKRLSREYPNRRICLVWDNASFHKGELIRRALKGKLSNFFLINFPPYAPDTNPQERIWRWSKDQIANHQYTSLKELNQTFRKIVMSRNYRYRI